jgi:RHS repeat-associated protein
VEGVVTYKFVWVKQGWEDVYFGGKRLQATDRLGSVGGGGRYYPYGEERSATAEGADKFATYHRDGTGFDYADQRYYSAKFGRFLTSDPFKPSATKGVPVTWNRYSYVNGDPVNVSDPRGLIAISFGGSGICSVGSGEGAELTSCDYWTISYDMPQPSTSGGQGELRGGDGRLAAREATTEKYRGEAKEALSALKQECKDKLKSVGGTPHSGEVGPGQDLFSMLTAATGSAYFYDVTGAEGYLTFGMVTGVSVMGPEPSLALEFSLNSNGATAMTLGVNRNGNNYVTNHVLLGPGFGNYSSLQRASVLLHELVHVGLAHWPGQQHARIASELGLGLFSTDASASQALTKFFEDCLRP